VKQKIKEYFKSFLRIAVSLTLLFIFFKSIEIEKLWDTFIKISPIYWFLSFLSVLLLQIISSFRWEILGKCLGFHLGLKRYISFYFVGMFFNLFLPTSIGGDVIKAVFLSKEEQGKLRAIYSILADRGLGLGGMFILGGIACIMDFDAVPYPFNVIILASAIATIIGLFIAPVAFNLIGDLIPKYRERIKFLPIFWEHPGVILKATLLSILIQLFANLCVWIISIGMGLKLSLSYYCIVYPLVSLLTLIPISLSGLGVREGGFIYFLSLQGVSAENALVLSLGSFLVQAVVSLSGGIVFMLGLHKKEQNELMEDIPADKPVV
jgi:uncharacterized membrane protein YbhN (UPF0104 family)